MLLQYKRQEHPGWCEEKKRGLKGGSIVLLGFTAFFPENVFYSQLGTVSLTFVMIIRMFIDICYSSISAKSTLVDVMKKS